MDLPEHIHPSAHVLVSDLGDEFVLLDTTREHYYGLEGVALRFWALLQEDPSVTRAVNRLLEEYEVDEGVLRRDLAHFWRSLAERGLVTPGPETA